MSPPDHEAVLEAARRLHGVAHRTPVMRSRTLDRIAGAEVFVKCENLQRAGAFKFRGAYNAISRLDPDTRARGVLAFSSGNHAQAVALASRILGVPATVIMPADAPQAKVSATRGYGAEVIPYDPRETVREELAERVRAERGIALIPPYDH
ncbi:MAG TPA: pyridoxal-phosphate dependent enzyme, partial [Longimicrobiaceae bacterium]